MPATKNIDMKKILLTQGKYAIVDDEDFDELNQQKWFFHSNGYAVGKVDGKAVYMHRVIAGTPSYMLTDHANGDKLDNQRTNLRICTYAQNGYNQRTNSGSSIYKGVCWITRDKKWRAQITLNKKRKFLGYFNNEIDAAKAYNEAATEHYGEFACLNEI